MSGADAATWLGAVQEVLEGCAPVIVACSGGIDSLLLATIAHRHLPTTTRVAHTVTPAVPGDGTARVMAYGRHEGWDLEIVRSREFDDERYLSNPENRCYFCKTNLYDAVAELADNEAMHGGPTIVSGANTDDLGEYRPGLVAADEHQVRHPYVEAGLGKAAIRAVARHLQLEEAEIAASPCLASRLYTGTRVTPARLAAIEVGEAVVRSLGIQVARCRIREHEVVIEVPEADRHLVTATVLDDVLAAMGALESSVTAIRLDDRPYRPGQAVLRIA
jgi:uncharacterized protein